MPSCTILCVTVGLVQWQAWGHSSVFDPFGKCLGTCEEKPATVYATLDFQEVATRRTNMPLEQQKRHDLYELVDKAG